MPELPDVEVFKRYLDATSLHQRITQVSILHKKIVRSISNAKFSRMLKERQLEESHRHGKVLFAKLNGSHGWVWLHFGMTGFLTYGNDQDKNIEDHVRLLLKFTNGHRFAFTRIETDYRKMMVKKTADIRTAEIELAKLLAKEEHDREAIQEQVNVIGNLKEEMMMARIDSLLTLKALLTKGQYAQFQEILEQRMKQMVGSGPHKGL